MLTHFPNLPVLLYSLKSQVKGAKKTLQQFPPISNSVEISNRSCLSACNNISEQSSMGDDRAHGDPKRATRLHSTPITPGINPQR